LNKVPIRNFDEHGRKQLNDRLNAQDRLIQRLLADVQSRKSANGTVSEGIPSSTYAASEESTTTAQKTTDRRTLDPYRPTRGVYVPETQAKAVLTEAGEWELFDPRTGERVEIGLPETAKVYQTQAGITVPSSYFLDLRSVYTSAYQVTVTADWLTLHDNSSPWKTIGLTSVNEVNDISVVGPGGRDQEAVFTGNSWIYRFVICNSMTGDVSSLTSASPTAPTLPTGFDYFVKTTSIHLTSNSPPNIPLNHFQIGKKHYVKGTVKFNQGPTDADTWESVNISGDVPATALYAFGVFGNSGTLTSQQTISIASSTAPLNEYTFTLGTRTAPGGDYELAHALFFDLPLRTSQQIAWKCSSTASKFAILIQGYEDDL
jgi:hypothetical protein